MLGCESFPITAFEYSTSLYVRFAQGCILYNLSAKFIPNPISV